MASKRPCVLLNGLRIGANRVEADAREALTAVATDQTAEQPAAPITAQLRNYRTAQTRAETRQVSGHFKPDVAQTLRLIAAEQSRDIQEILAEALNMVFARYGKAVRAEVISGRRKKTTT